MRRWQKDAVLKVEHLTMRFGGLTAVDDVSFQAGRSDITALIGPNGAGKTTVFNCITGFYKPTEGMLTLTHPDGSRFYLERLDDHDINSEARVARTFQNIRLFKGMTVLENLMVAQHQTLSRASGFTIGALFGVGGYRVAEEEAIQLAREWLRRVGLTSRADTVAGELSYGDQRRLEIARAMCTKPLLLCLDEQPAAAREFAEAAGVSFPVLIDADKSVSRAFRADSLPLAVLVDRSGVVRSRNGLGDRRAEQQLVSDIRALLDE